MYPRFDKNGLLIIEWYERKDKRSSPIHHYYEQRPLKIQLHPVEPKYIIWAHLPGKMPGWIKEYSKQTDHLFEVEEVQMGEECGWLLTNWHWHKPELKPIIAPNLQGALRKLIRKIPNVCQDLQQRLLENEQVVMRNLKTYNDIFKNIGVYYRPEEIMGDEGCLVIDHTVFLDKMKEETDEEYRARLERDGRLFAIVRELTYPLPELDIFEPDDEPLGELVPEDEPLGEIVPEEESPGETEPEDEPQGEIVPEDEPLGEIEPEEESPGETEQEDEPLGELVPEDEPQGEIEPEEESPGETEQEDEPQGEIVPEDEPLGETVPEAKVQEESSLPRHQFIVLEYNDRRAGVVEGQMSIF